MLKNKLYQYFASELLKNFILITASLSLLMLLMQAAKFLNIITEMGNSSLVYLKYTILNYPKIVEKVLPLGFLISIFFTISKLKNDKELNIFWYSGISYNTVLKIIILITLLIFLFYIILSIFLGPYFSNKARNVLAKSDFTLVNSLVKEKNFNSPLKGLTIYVDENDKKGNLKKIFIYENERIISSKIGRVIKKNNSIYLELIDGKSQEKNKNSIDTITFEKLIFDFSKFKTKNLKFPKFSEQSIFWLFHNLNSDLEKINDLRFEVNKRIIKPFFIFFIAIFAAFVIYNSENKYKLSTIYVASFLSLIINEILLGFSAKNFYSSIMYFFLIIFSSLFILKQHFK